MSNAEQRYPHVFQPIHVGPVEVRNRLYMPPHGIGLVAGGPHGSNVPSDDCAHYYEERARAGIGLLFHSLTTSPRHRLASPVFEESVPHFRAVADACHRHGARLMGQLHYYWGHTVPWEPLGAMVPVLGTNAYQRFELHDTVHELTRSEIREWIRAHGRCTRNLRAAGYDGVQVHSAHGMLVEQFLSPYYNKRTDEYGGSVENRMRVLVDALTEVREHAGPDMAVGIRFNCDEMLPAGITQDDARLILDRLLEMELIHYADLDIAVEPQQAPLMTTPAFMDPLHMVSFVASVGAVARSRAVVMAAGGRVTTIAEAERLVADGVMDMVGSVRGLIAEPELLKHAMEGHEERSRRCIACNFCISGQHIRTGWGCVINPATGRERRWGVETLRPNGPSRRVVVAGGGPAGMEAARVAALRGHRVTLIEAADELGGQLTLWAGLPQRDILYSTRDWYAGRLKEAGVDVRLGRRADAAAVLAEAPDAVIVATGAGYDRTGWSGFMPAPIPGWDGGHVLAPEDVLSGGRRPGGRVLVLDEEQIHTGVGIAQVLAEAGASVELVTRELTPVGPALYYTMEFPFVLPKLHSLGVRITTQTYLKAIEPGRAILFDILTNEETTRAVDAVVLATMRRPVNALAGELEGRVGRLYTVGDALAPRGLFEATYEGQRFARLFDDAAAPRTTGEALFSPSPDDVHPRPAGTLLER